MALKLRSVSHLFQQAGGVLMAHVPCASSPVAVRLDVIFVVMYPVLDHLDELVRFSRLANGICCFSSVVGMLMLVLMNVPMLVLMLVIMSVPMLVIMLVIMLVPVLMFMIVMVRLMLMLVVMTHGFSSSDPIDPVCTLC